MNDKEMKQEIEQIKTQNIYFLFGYYQRRLKIGLMTDELHEMTDGQAQVIVNHLWRKLRKILERVKE